MHLWHDVRYGARMLRKSPGFAATAVVTLGLGIGATTAIFSLSDAMWWKPVPLPDIDTLAMVLQRDSDSANYWNSATPADVDDIQRGITSLEGLASFERDMANIAGAGGEPERVLQTMVTANFFDTLQVQPARGRAFQSGEDQPGREREVILSDRLWRRRFGADPGIIGQSIRLNDQGYLVTGVMPDTFDFPLATELWTPMALTPAQRGSRRSEMLTSLARLMPERTIEQASAELDAVAARLAKSYPDTNKNRRFMLWTVNRFLVDYDTRQYLVMLLGSVLFVLLIACVNVANLQFARATGRLREVAVRTALGAGRWRVVAQLVTESVLLSLAGAGLGLLVARWGLNVMRGNMPPEVARYILGWKEMQIDGRALGFTLLAAVASGILAGLAPAWQCSRPSLTDTLKEGGRGSSSGKAHHRLRNVLVASEMALAVVLLVGASLMVHGFRAQINTDARLEPDTLLTLRLALPDGKYHEPHLRARFYGDVLARIQALPGVRSAAAASDMPYSDHDDGRNFTIEGRPVEPGNQPSAMYQVASPEYFETLHVRLREGRFPSTTDGAEAPRVAAISESVARRWWKKESPVGKHIKLGLAESKNPWITIRGCGGRRRA